MTDLKKYQQFIEGKRLADVDSGFAVDEKRLNKKLFPFQKALVKWALQRGRAAIFADCGLGKTPIQLEWARHVCLEDGGRVLIFAPLAVAKQTQREGEKFGIAVTVCRTASDMRDGINITNYEMLHHFQPDGLSGIVLDESGALKSFGGQFRKNITDFARSIKYRLACTATPAPNDLMEIINHATFLGVMSGKEIIALFFISDGNTTHAWRLKNHAQQDFWKWMASWSVALRKPFDLGFDDDGFILPALHIESVKVDHRLSASKGLLPQEASTLRERQIARRESVDKRVVECARLVNSNDEQWLVWCDLNAESAALTRQINGAVEVKGADSAEHKERSMLDFQRGKIRVLVTKPSIAGHGMNWQNCHNMVFVGLSDSYEQLYQATRRCWRFGQTEEVTAYHITSSAEGRVVDNIRRKEKQAGELFDSVIKHLNLGGKMKTKRDEMAYKERVETGVDWTLYLGDSIQTIRHIEDNSVGLSIFSPPFPGMYAYTNSPCDVGNTRNIEQFIDHFKFLVSAENLMRVLMPGRLAAIHMMQAPAMSSRDGYIGVKDYRGRIIEMMEAAGWIYAGEVCIDKNPQVQATRNKEIGLLFKTLATDSSRCRMALADYLLYFRKPGENIAPVRAGNVDRYNHGAGWINEQEWIEWAAPVWYRQTKGMIGGIRETDVLGNFRSARDAEDEKHLCPLQLGVIERAVKLWSAPGELVYSPFAGIGSEGYVALKLGRRFVGGELKESYFNVAVRNLRAVKKKSPMLNLAQVR